MDLNVCSRRVHDGYATIRSRGRNRPRAVYRSDSEELLKDPVGPYALPRVTNDPLSIEQINRVPRWSESGKNKLSENYGTLRRIKKSAIVTSVNREEEKIVLNTFSAGKNSSEHEKYNDIDDSTINERLYDTVTSSDNCHEFEDNEFLRSKIRKNLSLVDCEIIESSNNLNDRINDEKSLRCSTRRKIDITINGSDTRINEISRIRDDEATRQPIYAVPNITRKFNNENINDCRSSVGSDANYVPSGDLYRTTARYIEDINRNIAEIDKSYEELGCSTNISSSLNSPYGLIGKVSRSRDDSVALEQNDENIYSGFHRKRDILAPMPPISPNFGENTEAPLTPILTKCNGAEVQQQQQQQQQRPRATRFDFKKSRDTVGRTRPNSYGKLPPKLLPRSSSMDNNSSRHSTGSTTASSSTKSTESLCAINETLREGSKDRYDDRAIEAGGGQGCEIKKTDFHENTLSGNVFLAKILRNDDVVKKKLIFAQTFENDLRKFCNDDDYDDYDDDNDNDDDDDDDDDRRSSLEARLRRDRGSSNLNDETRRLNRDKCNHDDDDNVRVDRSYETDSMILNAEDRKISKINNATRKSADFTRSRFVDHPDPDNVTRISDPRARNKKIKNRAIVVAVRPGERKNKNSPVTRRCDSTGTIRRDRCSFRIVDDDLVPLHDANDDEALLIVNTEIKPKIIESRINNRRKKNYVNSALKLGSKVDDDADADETIYGTSRLIEKRRCDTLPCRGTKNSRILHKSSENVLDEGRRIKFHDDTSIIPRSCVSTTDVRDDPMNHRDDGINEVSTENIDSLPHSYLIDATELILHGELRRNTRGEASSSDDVFKIDEASSLIALKSSNALFNDERENFTFDKFNADGTMKKNNFYASTMTSSRTRHDSLESDDAAKKNNSSNDTRSLMSHHGGFATLPRRGNCGKEQRSSVDTPRRLSGNVPVLEPLYEHAVSDPVKPRTNDNSVIPWWELATRKYRHRSCPALQDHVVQAFEQSLSNMNQRLKQLTATAEKKDSELQELRETIERLRKQSAEAGLNGAAAGTNGRRHTLGDSDSGTTGCAGYTNNQQGTTMARQLSADSVTSLNSLSSACSASSHHRKKKGWLGSFSKKFSRARKNRHGSVSDAEDFKDSSGAGTNVVGDHSAPNSPRLPTAAKHENFQNKNHNGKSNGEKTPEHENPMTGSKSSSALYKKENENVDVLKEQLRQKDLVLTDITLEALKSTGELHSLKEKIAEMKNEMKNLRENNERLQRLVTSKSLTSSQSSMPTDPERRYSMTEVAYSVVAAMSNGDHHHHHHHHNSSSNSDQMVDMNVIADHHSAVSSAYNSTTATTTTTTTTTTTSENAGEQDNDGKRINVAIYLGSEKSFNVNLVTCSNDDAMIGEPPNCVIASVCISNKTTWDALDNIVRRCFSDYVTRIDPVTNLGLGVDHVAAYHLGESSRFTNETQHPELLPCGYLIGHVKTIYLVLNGFSWLAIDTLIPKSIVQRLLSLLTEHRRLILCGPSGTGKNYLAGKLAHALVDADSDVDAKDAAAVATFNVDHKSSKELRQYLAHIAERCDSNAADELPKVIILENLQHAASLGELFSGLLGTRHSSCPAIIGTMSQATCSTTNLQLHHNFRWVLCRKDMEPVKGFLGRYLRRKLLEQQLRDNNAGARHAEMSAVVEWLPRVWLHLNKFLETHSGNDVTIGPSLFLSCPMEVAGSQVWFTDLWNYSIRPYLVEAVKEGNGEAAWEDPAQFITTTYPWIATHAVHGGRDALLRLRPEDVGYDVVSSGHNSGVGASSVKSLGSTHSDTEGDPLLNMLMRLQEAANYSSPHSNDSDSVTSMDSSHTRHSEDLSTSTSSSRGVESAL